MAYDKISVTITFEDTYGRRKRKEVEMVTDDAATAEIDAASIATAYDAATDGFVRRYQVNSVNEFEGAVGAGINADSGVTCTCQLNGRPERASLKWPMPLLAMFLPDGRLNTTHASIVALEGIYAPTTGIATLSDGEEVDSILSGQLDK